MQPCYKFILNTQKIMIQFLVIPYLHLLDNIHYVVKFYSIWVIVFAHPLLTLDIKMDQHRYFLRAILTTGPPGESSLLSS